jgi:hypothetical protein
MKVMVQSANVESSFMLPFRLTYADNLSVATLLQVTQMSYNSVMPDIVLIHSSNLLAVILHYFT